MSHSQMSHSRMRQLPIRQLHLSLSLFALIATHSTISCNNLSSPSLHLTSSAIPNTMLLANSTPFQCCTPFMDDKNSLLAHFKQFHAETIAIITVSQGEKIWTVQDPTHHRFYCPFGGCNSAKLGKGMAEKKHLLEHIKRSHSDIGDKKAKLDKDESLNTGPSNAMGILQQSVF